MWTRIGFNDTSPTTRARARSAGRLAPRRRHRLPNCLWCRFAVEGVLSISLSPDPRPHDVLKLRNSPRNRRRRAGAVAALGGGLRAWPLRAERLSGARGRAAGQVALSMRRCSTGTWSAASASPRSASARPRGPLLLGPLVVDPAVKGKGYRQGAGRGGLGAGARRRLCAGAARRRHALLRAVRLSSRCRRGRSACRGRSIPRGCLRSSLFPARWPGPRARSKATRANGLRGTRSRPAGRAAGRARGSR